MTIFLVANINISIWRCPKLGHPQIINLCLRGGLGWWFGSLGIDGFVNLEKTKKYQTLQTMKSLKIKKTNLKQQ
jgi:hypothetical protein